MSLSKTVPDWYAEGAEPPESLKQSGFSAGYKPPAPYFNWYWHGMSEAVKELQEVAGNISGAQNIETYASLEQLGLSGSVSLDNVKDALPNGSRILMSNNTDLANSVAGTPSAYGTLEVVKAAENYTVARWVMSNGTTCMEYINKYHATHGWTGWTLVYNASNKPTPADIGALPLDGSLSMTGKRLDLYNKYGWVFANENMFQAGVTSNGEGANDTALRAILLRNDAYESNLANAIALLSRVNGVDTAYKLFGEHNTDLLATQIQSLIDSGVISMSAVKSVQRGKYSYKSGLKTYSSSFKGNSGSYTGYVDITIASVDTTKSTIYIDNFADVGYVAEFISATTIRVYVYSTSDKSYTFNVNGFTWEVVEYA